jgi:large repetitive protein
MTRGSVRRLGAAGLVLACVVGVTGQAGAADPPALSINDPSVTEGTGGGPTALTFTVTRTGDLSAPSRVTASTPSGSSSDYSPKSEVLDFAIDEASKTFSVDVVADDLDEANETVVVTLSSQTNATLGDASGTGTIADDDATPTLAITGPATIAESGTAGYTVAITGKSAEPVTVNWAAANGTTANADYGPPRSGTLNWPSGDDNSRSISIPMVNDALDEVDETFSVNLSGASGATITTATATTAITDNDAEPSVGTVSDVTVTEGNTGTVDASITVTLSAPSGKTVTVPYATAPASATEGADYEHKTGSYVFAPGDVSEAVIFKVKGDTVFEQEEKFSVVLTDPINGASGADMRGEITITDDDSTPIPTLTSPSVLEGNPPGSTNLVFEASLAAPHPAVTFNFRTVAETANTTDFDAASGSKLFPANSSTAAGAVTKVPITITVKADLLDEVDETMKLELLNNTDVVVRTATGTIRNDDDNSKLAVSDASADEPGTMTFTVTLSQASGREVKVNWATADGTATAGADYSAGSGALTFAPGDTAKTIDVAVLGDTTTEENETVKVNLSSPSGIPENNVLDGQGDGTIIDKNAPPSLSISDAITREGQGATFTVTLAGTTLRTVTVSFNTIEATAKAGSDFAARSGTLTFAAGEKAKTITVTVLDDTAPEPTEDFFVGIGDAVNATITKNRGLGAIEGSDQVAQPPTTDPKKPVAKPASVLVPRMILGPRTVSIGVNGIARMLVTCQKLSPIRCAGTVELERAARPLLKLGKKTFTVTKGAKGYASIKLSAKTLKLLRKNGTMRAKVIVLVKTSTKTMKVSPGIITLKATKSFLNAKPKPAAPPTKVVVDP